ncbi:MAG TPA: N-6 DNA methylase [Ktedonobacteraceae bacterium]|nr:N-6 DNA methylase [Ktedonobacteraceae bacterium]
MVQSPLHGKTTQKADPYEPTLVVATFLKAVIERFSMTLDTRSYSYQEYLALPATDRSNDEADAVDARFARYTLEWLGFGEADWNYNRPQAGQKANRPDYTVNATVGTAFIWEDKNSTLELDEKHLRQMVRYCVGTAGYAIWCNMRRIYAVRFIPGDTFKYEMLVDVSIEQLLGNEREKQSSNLALFRLLFGKERFTQFQQLINNICVNEQTFEQVAIPLDNAPALQQFINGSRLSLDHLRLAALSQVREAIEQRELLIHEDANLRLEWERIRDEFINKITFSKTGLDIISQRVLEEIEKLTPQIGKIQAPEILKVRQAIEKMLGKGRLRPALAGYVESWMARALRINNALLELRFKETEQFGIAEAYGVWSERQSDQEDVRPEVFAEQVAYVFFVRLLLVRVLEDKAILRPRFMSNGGFRDWSEYVKRHFRELDGVGILNENYCNILARKAGHYYLHFFQQAIFDWFNPDDFLFVETLEFLCRYNFQNIASDLIGFTYEEYIDRTARNRKGHFLTRDDVVDYMLDLLDYSGPHIVGRRMLDPASGSGSFLVHAARRYRTALRTFFCNQHGLADSEEAINAHPALRKEFARRYLDDLTSLFFGMELNPFACYLAEMNLLIQGLDDYSLLQQSGDARPIERFHIYNTNSLELPREVLDSADVTGTPVGMQVTDYLSERIIDEAFPIKAKLDNYTEGFFYVISNPPYVNSRQEELHVRWFKLTEFYKAVLSGDTNLYLLFLRLGLYYLSPYGQMVYIVPLTIFGDKSASAMRQLLKTPPYIPAAAVRFYRGNILFPGVDQAVAMVRVNHTLSDGSIIVSGGNTPREARKVQFTTSLASVTDAAPQNHIWQGNWLVAQSQESVDIWNHTKQISSNLATNLKMLLDNTFDIRQGDINATFLNPLRLGARKGSFASGAIAIYKGQDVKGYKPLSFLPSDWAKPLTINNSDAIPRETVHASEILQQIKQVVSHERGIVLRQVARLNTRERLLATWFERKPGEPIAFTNEVWRMILKDEATEEYGKALLALINSKITAYLINLFSTNNHVGKDELDRMPIPDPQTMPVAQLATLADALLSERSRLEQEFAIKYRARLPKFDDGNVYVPPSAVLAQTRLPRLTLSALVGRGEVKNTGPLNGRIRALSAKNLIVSTLPSSNPNSAALTQVLDLFLHEPGHENETWTQAQSWQLPDTIAANAWLTTYNTINQQAQTSWQHFVALHQQCDNIVADWYGFNANMRQAIDEGLPWAKKQKEDVLDDTDEG